MDRHADVRKDFRFSYMSERQDGHQLTPETLDTLAMRLTAPGTGERNSTVPSGYTYLGQVIAHDLSFDLTKRQLGRVLPLERLRNAASPTLDLDTLYGGGPVDDDSKRFYVDEQGPQMVTGRTAAADPYPAFDGWDLPRGEDGDPRKAMIPDPRNDDNVAVAQTHAALIRFHNRVAEEQTTASDPFTRFEQARDIVTRHVQWIVWFDFLPRICDPGALDDVLAHGRKTFEVDKGRDDQPTMPLEFSAGVFRLGHSMVRSTYDWNRCVTTLGIDDLFVFSGRGGDLDGHDAVPSTRTADFRRLYDFTEIGRPDLEPPELNVALAIDTRLTRDLRKLPAGTIGLDDPPRRKREANLAFRNLMKARKVGLASGQDMARFLDMEPLTARQISHNDDGMDVRLDYALGEDGLRHTPLWVYALREAERTEERRLTGVGARIVAETFHRAIEASRTSIFDGSGWEPTVKQAGKDFCMAHLLLYAFEPEPSLFGPLDPPPDT